MSTKNMRMIALFLFAWTMLGAKDCGSWSRKSTKDPAPAPPLKPFCHADPPYGCLAICAMPGQPPAFTDNCNDLGRGPLTHQFVDEIMALDAQFAEEGQQLCSPDTMFATATPCDVGIVPQQLEFNDACMSLPPNCAL
jgi:hypothetical protein